MADALLSPAVGAVAWVGAAALVAVSARRVRESDDERIVPLMGVLAAFVFAAQMINFAIPGTGSSGHIGGGLLLAILLGPHAAFLVMASVLTVQALLFADGGLLALGANIINLGFFPCYIAYPLVYRILVRDDSGDRRIGVATILATIVGLQLGALGVVIETSLSGIAALPFSAFLWLMQPIHLAIALVEGFATATVVILIRHARPDLLLPGPAAGRSLRPVIVTTFAAAALMAGGVSAVASAQPDGLEWSIEHIAGKALEPDPGSAWHARLARLQEFTALMPDYSAGQVGSAVAEGSGSIAGLVGGMLTFCAVAVVAAIVRWRARRRGG